MACMMEGCPPGLTAFGSAPSASICAICSARSLVMWTHQSEGFAAWLDADNIKSRSTRLSSTSLGNHEARPAGIRKIGLVSRRQIDWSHRAAPMPRMLISVILTATINSFKNRYVRALFKVKLKIFHINKRCLTLVFIDKDIPSRGRLLENTLSHFK